MLYFTETQVFRVHHPAYRRDECVLMQFTGLYDCTGRKLFEGDVVYEYYPEDDQEPALEFWRLIVFRSGGFYEVASLNDTLDQQDLLANFEAAHRGEWLESRIVDCYYARPYLLDLNAEDLKVPESFMEMTYD